MNGRHTRLRRHIRLACHIALINTYNRMNVIAQTPAGDYQPGQWDDL